MESQLPLELDLNPQFAYALHLLEHTNKNVFVTGKAGTGKSTLLQYFRERTKKRIVVLAPTGVAAVNVKGQTIHSFFNFKPDITPQTARDIKPRNKKLYKELDAIVIDEISMVRADLLDSIDIFLKKYGKSKKKPFGGIQMIFIGDLYQLPPVVTSKERKIFSDCYRTPYFFDAKVFDCPTQSKPLTTPFEMEFVELEKVYRQKDEDFIALLNAIRHNCIDEKQLERLNERYLPNFKEAEGDFYIHLTTTKELANSINRDRLNKVKGKSFVFKGYTLGEFPKKELPTSEVLELKIGAQVMLLNNDSLGRWINGSLGIVRDIEKGDDDDIIVVELANKMVVEVLPYKWDIFRFEFDEESNSIISETVGSFIQYPLMLAWAITIHKSQGKTFDKVIIDFGKGTFSPGQTYVALSRCTSFEGIILKRPLEKRHIMMDRRVVSFVTKFQYAQSEKRCPLEKKVALLKEAIEKERDIEIVYLKTKDEKSRRVVKPLYVGKLEYNGKTFIGLRAFCTKRLEERTFRIDRILEINEV